MFVRFRQTLSSIQVSLVETRRIDGRVRHEHVAGLGSIAEPMTIADRVAFWSALYQRLAKLSNRIDAEAHGKILGSVHARIPMVTIDEQCALQLENAEADEKFWTGLQDMNADQAEGHKGLAALASRNAAEAEAGAADAGKKAAIAKERRERIAKGDPVPGGLGKPVDFRKMLLDAGYTKEDLRRWKLMADVGELITVEEFSRRVMEARDRDEVSIARKILRKHGRA
jgi:hypothetical protein